jgi:DNA polymerase I-like protein with 3'-5' exonuclease and polymerase domains
VAGELLGRIKARFPTAYEWMRQRQEAAKVGPVEDYFGRPRAFEEGKAYLARNFSVQGVAATVCQEHLIELDKALPPEVGQVAYTVHDGFGLTVSVPKAREAYRLTKGVLEAESRLCPGLRMNVEIKFGAKLDAMKVLWKD